MSYLEPSPTNFFRRPYVRDYDPGTFVPDDLPSMWLNYLTGQVFLFVGQTDGVGRWSNITTVAAGQVSNVSITDGTDSALAVMGVFRINNAANSGIVITLGGNIISIMIADGGVISQKIADGAVTRDKLAQDIINDIANAQQSGMIQVNSTNISNIINTAEIQWLVDSINNTASASIQNESIAEGKLDPAVQTKLNATGDRIGFNGTDGENIVNSPDVQWTLNGTDASASIPVQSINQDKLSIAVQTLLNRQLQFNNQDVASVSTGNNIVSNYNAITKNLDLTVQLPSFPQPLQFNNQNVSVLVQGDNIVGTIDNAGRLTFSTNDPITYNGQIITSVDAGANMDIAINEQGHALFSALGGGDATLREFEESLFTRHDPPDSYVSTVEFYNTVISNEDPYTSILEYNDDTYEGQLETLSSDAINCQQDSLFNVITLTVSEASMAGYVLLSDATFYSFTRDATNVIVTVRNSDGTPATRALVDVHRPTRDPNTNAITALTRVNAVNPDSQGDAIMGDVQAHDIIMISAVWEYAEAINYVSVSQDVSLMAGDASRFERRESSEEQGIEDVTFPLRQVRDDVIEKSELLEIVQSDISPGLEEVLEAFYSEKSPSLFFLEVTTPDTNYVECLVIAIRSSLFKRFATGVNTAHIRLMRNVGGTVVDGQVQGGTSSVISDNLNWKLVNRRDSGDNQLGDEVTETLYQTEVNITTETGIYWLEGHTAHNVIVAVVHSSNEARLQAQINFNAQKILQLQQKTHCIHTTQTVNEVTTDDVAVTFIETRNTSRVTDIQILNATYASTVPAVPSSTNAAPRTGVLAIRIAEDLNRNEYVFLLQNADGSFATAGNHNGNEFKNQIQDAGATHDYYALGISADSLELATIMPDQTLVIRKVTSKNEWAGTLADDVVETDDIQDDNVTLPKLSPNVRSMLGGGSGGGGSKSVSTSTFTSTDGTSGGTTTQTTLFAFRATPTKISGGGTKAFGARGYRLLDIFSSPGTNAPTTNKTLTGAEVAVLGWMNGASTRVLELRGSTNTFVLGSSGDQDEGHDPLLLEIWRPTYDQAGVLVSATNVFQRRRVENDLFQNISVQQGDLLLVAEDIADSSNVGVTTQLRVAAPDGVTITTPGTPALGSTTKTSSDETQLFTDLTFDSRQQRNDVTEKATLLDRRITTLTDAESIPFLYLEDTEESAMATISSDNLPGFVENPIFSVRASFVESFKVSEASGVITSNIRLMRTRGETVTVVSETTDWSLRGKVTSSVDANMVDISENIFYCVRITETPENGDIYALEGHTSRHEINIGGEGSSKSVSTSTVDSTDGTMTSSSTVTVLSSSDNFNLHFEDVSSGEGTKDFGGDSYFVRNILSTSALFFDSKTLTVAELTVLGWTGGASAVVQEIRGSGALRFFINAVSTAPDNRSILLEAWRPTYDQAGVLTSATNVLQRRVNPGDFIRTRDIPSFQQGDIFVLGQDSSDSSYDTTNLIVNAPDDLSRIETTVNPPALGSTTKTSSSETQLFPALTFDSRQQRDDVTEKATLLDRRITTLTDAESVPFLYLEDTEESSTATISTDNLPGFVENPIFSVRASFVESFKVSETSGVITANIRLMRTRGETSTVVSETTQWSLRGKVASAVDANMVDISENIFYCVRITDTPQDEDVYALEGHTTRHELDIARMMMMSGGGTVPTVDETRLFTSATQKRNSNAKTYLLTIVQNTIDDPIREVAVYGTEVQEASTYTILSDDVSGTNFTVRVRSSTLLKANFGTNLRLVITRSGTDTNLAVDSSYVGEGSTIEGGVDSDGNDISDLAFIAINFPVSGNLETDDVVRLETHTSVNVLQEQQDIIDNRSLISVLNTAIMNLPTPTTATLPKILQDIANNVTETNVATGTGTWQRVSPDPYIDRVNISREVALFEDGENRTTTGSDQLTGNTFDDITPEISITTTSPRYYPTGTTIPNQPWPERTSFDEQAVTVENMTGNTTPIQNIWGKIIVFDLYIYDVNNYPTTDVDLLRGGSSGAHPLISMRRVGNEVSVYAETITSRSAGSSTYTYRIQLNANPVIIDGMIGQENNHFIVIPDDWGDEDDIRMRFFLFRKSDHTLFTNVQTVPSSTFDIANLTTAVPEVEFTVSWTLEDGTVISSPYHAEYRAVRNGNGDYTMELSNASLTDNLGSDYQAEVYIDRGTLTSHGSVNNYTQQQMGSGMTTGQSRTFVVTFYPNDDELTDADARLYMVYADSTGFNNNINLDRAIGDDQLAFNRITFNDNPNIHASAVSRMEMYSYTTNPFVPSHSQLIAMWQNRGNYIGLFVHPTRNVMAFRVNSPIEWLADNIATGSGGGAGNKTVATSSFTVTAGTGATESMPATYDTWQWASGRGANGTKTIDGVSYTARPTNYLSTNSAWETTAGTSSDDINELFGERNVGTAAMSRFSWTGVTTGLRVLNTFSVTGSYQISNVTPSTSSVTFPPTTKNDTKTLAVEIWTVDTPTGRFNSETLNYQLVLEDNEWVDIDVTSGDILLVAELTSETSSTAPNLRFREELTPAVDSQEASTGSVSKTSTNTLEGFADLTFSRMTERDDTVDKSALLRLQAEPLVEEAEVPFLFLERTLESTSITIDNNMLDEFVNSPVISLRNSVYNEWNVGGTLNLRLDKIRGDTTTTVTLGTFTNRGKVSGATTPAGTVSYEDYVCYQITDTDIQNGDIFRLFGHTNRLISNDRNPVFQGQPVRELIQGAGASLFFRNGSLTIGTDISSLLSFFEQSAVVNATATIGILDATEIPTRIAPTDLTLKSLTNAYSGSIFQNALFSGSGTNFTSNITGYMIFTMPVTRSDGRTQRGAVLAIDVNVSSAFRYRRILRPGRSVMTYATRGQGVRVFGYNQLSILPNATSLINSLVSMDGVVEDTTSIEYSITVSSSPPPGFLDDVDFVVGGTTSSPLGTNAVTLSPSTILSVTVPTATRGAVRITPIAGTLITTGSFFERKTITSAEATALGNIGTSVLSLTKTGHYVVSTSYVGMESSGGVRFLSSPTGIFFLVIRPTVTNDVITGGTLVDQFTISQTPAYQFSANSGDILYAFYAYDTVPLTGNTGGSTLKIKYHIQQPDYPALVSGTPLSAGTYVFNRSPTSVNETNGFANYNFLLRYLSEQTVNTGIHAVSGAQIESDPTQFSYDFIGETPGSNYVADVSDNIAGSTASAGRIFSNQDYDASLSDDDIGDIFYQITIAKHFATGSTNASITAGNDTTGTINLYGFRVILPVTITLLEGDEYASAIRIGSVYPVITSGSSVYSVSSGNVVLDSTNNSAGFGNSIVFTNTEYPATYSFRNIMFVIVIPESDGSYRKPAFTISGNLHESMGANYGMNIGREL